MNANAIYSKSGKGVQEAAGKTSNLSRPDRAVLAAIDGRATLADVAQKVGKTFDAAFEKLIGDLDKNGFIRQVSAGTAAAAKPGAAPAKPAAAGKGPDPASDLDFTAALTVPRAKPAPSTQPPPRAAPAAPPPPPPPPAPSVPDKAKAEQIAKQQQDAFTKAREEAEKKAQAERDRLKAEAEAKVKAETEAKLRAEAKDAADKKFAAELEAKTKAEAEAKIKAARDAAAKIAAEAKAKAEAEAKKAREEAERIRKETEEKARREQEELRRKLEEERKAREEAERKAREEAKRLEEERRKLEEERQRREEELRREEEERAARRKREEAEEQERKRKKREQEEEEERREAAERAERKRRQQEEDEREQAEREARRKAKEAEAERETPLPVIEEKPKEKPKAKPKAPEPAKPAGGGFADTLLADLDSFNTREEEEQKAQAEAARKEKEEAIRRALEADEARKKEEAEREAREEKQRRKQAERERKAREEAELREAEEKEKERLKEEEEKRKQEAEERAKKAKQEEKLAARATASGTFDAADRARREAALMGRSRPKAGGGLLRAERKSGWGKPIAITLFLLALIAVGVAHVMPIDVSDYQTAATDALRRPVKIRSANLSLVTGLELKFHDVQIGDTRLPLVRAFPELGSLTGPKKVFSRIEIEGGKLEQGAVGDALFAKVQADNFSVGRIVARNIELAGPLAIPKGVELEANYDAEGNVRGVQVRGPQALLARVARKGDAAEFDASASTFTLPFAPEIALSTFSMKGSITPRGMNVKEWDGQTLNGTVSGTANVRWGDNWTVDGVLTARNINAAVFAPALLSDGRGEGSGKFSMRGEPGKLAGTGRIDGTFTVTRGVLGSIDLAKAIQSGGKTAQGRTQFNEMTGQASYDRGALALRSVTISAGQLNAGASVDISEKGALSGRIVADVKIASQQQRATLLLGGTLQEPLVKN
jgi:hypothetical protein